MSSLKDTRCAKVYFIDARITLHTHIHTRDRWGLLGGGYVVGWVEGMWLVGWRVYGRVSSTRMQIGGFAYVRPVESINIHPKGV